MNVISRKTLREFWEKHADAEQPLKAWYYEADRAGWKNSAEIKAKYRTASILSSERVVFNIAGNKYRLIVVVKYRFKAVYVRFVGTHKDYDRVDAETI
jgi:mRNA interferase HigB